MSDISFTLLNGEKVNFLELIDFKEVGSNALVSELIKWHNECVDVSLRFAYSVFGAIARDKNTGELGDLDDTAYLFEVSPKNGERLKSAIEEAKSGFGRKMTLEKLGEELNISFKRKDDFSR